MHRKSTDLEFYRDKKLVIDADGVEVALPVEPFELATGAEEAARSAKQDADRAERVASTTSWSGDKLTVFGKTSPSLTGPRGPEGFGNTTTVKTEDEAQALTGLPKGHKVYVVATKTWYEEE